MYSFEKFVKAKMPAREAFYSNLNSKSTTEEEYEHVQKHWEVFGCKHLGDYHDKYGLGLAHYYSLLGLS